MFTGFEVGGLETNINHKTILYTLPANDPSPIKMIVSDFFSALGYAFSIFTLQTSKIYRASGEWTAVLAGFARVFIYIQVALLLLAVRRRFKQ